MVSMFKAPIIRAKQDCQFMYSIARDRCLMARSEIKNPQLLENYLGRIKIAEQQKTTFMHFIGFFVGNYTTYCPSQCQLDKLDNLIIEKLDDMEENCV